MRIVYLLLAGWLLLGGAVERVSAQTMLDALPRDAAACLAIRNLDELIDKGDKFLAASKIQVGLRPSQLFDEANRYLRIEHGLNKKGSAAIMLMSPAEEKKLKLQDLELQLVAVIPFTDTDLMGKNFKFDKGMLQPKEVLRTKRDGGLDNFATRTQSHYYLSPSKTTLERLVKSPSLGEVFTVSQRRQINDSDIMLHLGKYVWTYLGEENFTRELHRNFEPGDDPEEKRYVDQLNRALLEIQHAVFCFRVGADGLGGHSIMTVPAKGEAAKLLQSQRQNRPPCSLRGLPEGNVLLAQASSANEFHHGLAAKGMFGFFLRDMLQEQGVIAPLDRLQYLGVFHEVWNQLDGNRVALYHPTDRNQGLFSVVAILDAEDPVKVLRDARTLAKMANATSLDWSKKEVKEEINIPGLLKDLGSSLYPVRQSAATRLMLIGEPAMPYIDKALAEKGMTLETSRRTKAVREHITSIVAARRKELLDGTKQPLFVQPKLTYVAAAEKRAGRDIDVIRVELGNPKNPPDKKYQQWLGPDWDKVRLTVVGKKIIVLIGSDVGLFDTAVSNIQNGSEGLAKAKQLEAFEKLRSKERLYEVHVSSAGMLRLMAGEPSGKEPPSLSSLGLTLEATSLQLDAWLPMAEIRAVANKAQPQ
jgi:hypothetical protein